MDPATIQQKREYLLERSTKMLNEMNGIPAYDAIKPRIKAATEKFLDLIIEIVGDAPLFEHQEDSLLAQLTTFTGMISGTLTRLELTPEDVEKTVQLARQQIEQGMRKLAAAAYTTPRVTITNPHDIN